MKKAAIFVIAIALLLPSCNLGNFLEKFSFEDEGSSDYVESSSTASSSKSSSSKKGKYDDYKDREWYNVGLDSLTDSTGNNLYYNSLINYDTFKPGKYVCDDKYTFCICKNGDAAIYYQEKYHFFDFSEYTYVTAYESNRGYSPSTLGYSKERAMRSYYYELAIDFYGIYADESTYESIKCDSLEDIYGVFGVVILGKTMTIVDEDDTTSYVCNGCIGDGPTSYDEAYILTTYMNHNKLVKYSGMPSFFSSNNLTGWAYTRKPRKVRGKRVWQDVQLSLTFGGYTGEDVRSMITLLRLAGYTDDYIHDELDSDSPYISYEAQIEILGFTSNWMNHTGYIKNKIKLSYSPSKYDEKNKPIEYSVNYIVDYAESAWWDAGPGTFVLQGNGLFYYYTDEGAALVATIVNMNGELETACIVINEGKETLTFSLPHATD